MDRFNGRLVAGVGVERAAADQAVCIALHFAIEEGLAAKRKTLIDTIDLTQHSNSGAGLNGGVMGNRQPPDAEGPDC